MFHLRTLYSVSSRYLSSAPIPYITYAKQRDDPASSNLDSYLSLYLRISLLRHARVVLLSILTYP